MFRIMINKKTYIVLIIFLLSLPSFAQEFDKAFLDSLPNEVREQLEEEKNQRDALEETQYRRPSSLIRKAAPLENTVFGAEIFSMMQTTLMPINEPNFDSSYILDFGDELELQLTGSKSLTTKLLIKRDGSISLPDIGKINVSGLPLKNVSEMISNKYEQAYIGVKAFISLTNVRDIQIIVAGNVFNPGPYILNGNSNIFHALTVSGGPSEQGSFRSISLIRNNKKIQDIDLYDLLIFGNSSFDQKLKSGDVIFVNPLGNLVSVYGAFNRVGTYEFKENEDLSNILIYSNGIASDADKNKIVLSQINEGRMEYKQINDINKLSSFNAIDKTNIYINKIKIRSVNIIGAVQRPGKYFLEEGANLLDLIDLAGGYNSNAYSFGGILQNITAKEINKSAMNKLKQSLLEQMLVNSDEKTINSGILDLYNELKEQEIIGRVTTEFDYKTLKADPSKAIILQDGDDIYIPETTNHIHVYGNVLSPGTVTFDKNLTIKDYIELRGGINDLADLTNTFIMHPDGMVEKYSFQKNIFLEKGKDNSIYPGSVIYIPKAIDDRALRIQAVQGYASILSSLGVSLASLSVLNN